MWENYWEIGTRYWVDQCGIQERSDWWEGWCTVSLHMVPEAKVMGEVPPGETGRRQAVMHRTYKDTKRTQSSAETERRARAQAKGRGAILVAQVVEEIFSEAEWSQVREGRES